MKPINAFMKVKDFSNRIEILNTSLRTTTGIEQLKYAKDYFVSLETLKIPEALNILAEYFKKESLSCAVNENYSEMFLNWSLVLKQRSDNLQETFPSIPLFKNSINDFISWNKGTPNGSINMDTLKQGTDALIKGVQLYVEDLICLENSVYIFESFILPKMTAEELKPEAENIGVN